MKILLVYPRYPDTFWSFRHALKFLSKKASFPPLGLLTVAAMLPAGWEKKLVDLNVCALNDEDIEWADYVFLSSMVVQKTSAGEVIERCRNLNTSVVAGGPLFTTGYEEFEGVDHFVLGEAEVTLPPFLADLAKGQPRHIYSSDERPDISQTPAPLWSLINMKHYSAMSLQYSRGCPFDCEFCDITLLNGHEPRTKSRQQMVDELEALYRRGWRGSLFIVDDNFIGNRRKLKTETLPAMIQWSRQKKYPFVFFTEASINLADDEELMDLMAEAGFNRVFVGIETPNEESLVECNKQQNRNRDLAAAVKLIQNHGFEVQGGFILGFDSDPASIFNKQIHFIQKTGIVTAMVGLLNAPNGTKLYKRLKKENRLIRDMSGDNTDFSINFVPKMQYETLVAGYKHVLDTIYSPRHYYERVVTFLKEYRPRKTAGISQLRFNHITGFIKSMWFLGIWNKGRRYYWRLLISTLLKRPRHFPLSISLSVSGFHFRRVAEGYNRAVLALRHQGANKALPL
ncbi:MAG: B12-binding domain-containing radical SAM protein [Chloroflexi bacterium RBG_16_56_11]|nr:MAG: B12-binding domain-containing radical SAM protein [Chloroflexi bacterium RBG_16_56_11]